jgi:hypothetical protein
MLELVDSLEELIANVQEYQRAIKATHQHRGRITPSLVRAWYYIPALNMVAASRFIGYKGMTLDRYENSNEVDGKVTEPRLQRSGWFRQLSEKEPQYNHAWSLAAALSPTGRLWHSARFNVLKKPYDDRVRQMLRQTA